MRRPIQVQLLAPMLLVVLLSVALSSMAGAWLSRRRAREVQQQNLTRVVATLQNTGIPLKASVLKQMSGLSGAEFVVLDERGDVRASTIPVKPAEAAALRELRATTSVERWQPGVLAPIGQRNYWSARVPLSRAESLIVLAPEEFWGSAAREAAFPPLLAGIVTAAVAVAITTLLARGFVRPIQQLRRQAAAISEGEFQPLPLPSRDDELRDLTVAINRMVEQLEEYETHIRRSERLRTLGQLGAGMAHQLRNAVTGAQMALEFHDRELDAGADRESLLVARRQLELMESSLQRFLRLGQQPAAAHALVALDELVDEVLPLVQPLCRHAQIELDWTPPEKACRATGDADSLRQLLLNLLMNAIEAAQAGGRPARVGVGLATSAGKHRLQICDTGKGPPAEIADELFEPFATSKPDGTGLGLAVARQIASEHRGRIEWRREGAETIFEFALSRVDGDAATTQPADRGNG